MGTAAPWLAAADGEEEDSPPLLLPVDEDPPPVAVGEGIDIEADAEEAASEGSMLPQGILLHAFCAWALSVLLTHCC